LRYALIGKMKNMFTRIVPDEPSDIHDDRKKREVIFIILYGIIALILFNLVMYFLSNS